MADVAQLSFSGGRISKRLHGRADTQGYANSLAEAVNVIIEAEGIVSRRPGTRLVRDVEGNAWSHNSNQVRLIPYRPSNADQLVLVFRDRAFDVVQNGAVVARIEDDEIPWEGKDLVFDPRDDAKPGIKFSQYGEELVITHPKYLPRIIRRRNEADNTKWVIGFASQAKRKPSATKLSAVASEPDDDPGPDFELSYQVIGVGANREYLSEVPAVAVAGSDTEFPGFDIEALTVQGRLAEVKFTGDAQAGGFETGNRVFLTGMTGASELNNRGFEVVDIEYVQAGDTKEEGRGEWVTAATAAQALTDARARLPAIYDEDVTYETSEEGVDRTEQQKIFFVFYFYGSSKPANVTDQQFTSVLASEFTGWSFDRTSARTAEREYEEVATYTNGVARDIPENWASHSTGAGVTDPQTKNARFTGAGTLYRALGVIDIYRSVAAQGRFRALAKGSRTIPSNQTGYGLVRFNTGVPTVTPWSSDGRISGSIYKLQTKRHAKVTLSWEAPAAEVDHFAIFQKAEGGWGLVDRTPGRSLSTTIQNTESDQFVPPPKFRDPFAVSNPNCSCVFQQRRGFGGFLPKNYFYFSRPGLLDQFDFTQPLQNDDAIEGALGTGEVNEIRHMVPATKDVLFVFTSGAIHSISSGDAAFHANSVHRNKEQDSSNSNLEPLSIGDAVLSVNGEGSVIQATSYSFEKDGYVTGELSTLFSDLLEDKKIVSWAYVEGHRRLVIAVLSDGTAVCVTYRPQEQSIGAATWEFGGKWKCRGVSVVNTNEISPIAVFAMESPEGKMELWSMEFARGDDLAEFTADRVTNFEFVNPIPKGKDGEWVFWKQNSLINLRDVSSDDVPLHDGKPASYMKGISYDTKVRTLPAWDLRPSRLQRAFVRLLDGWGTMVRALPGGRPEGIRRDDGKDDNLEGIHSVFVNTATRSSHPQIEVVQSVPGPMLLTGVYAFETGKTTDPASSFHFGPVRNGS